MFHGTCTFVFHEKKNRQTNRRSDRQTDRHIDVQTDDGHTDERTNRWTDRGRGRRTDDGEVTPVLPCMCRQQKKNRKESRKKKIESEKCLHQKDLFVSETLKNNAQCK